MWAYPVKGYLLTRPALSLLHLILIASTSSFTDVPHAATPPPRPTIFPRIICLK